MGDTNPVKRRECMCGDFAVHYVEYYKKAVKHYETTNETEFDCILSQ